MLRVSETVCKTVNCKPMVCVSETNFAFSETRQMQFAAVRKIEIQFRWISLYERDFFNTFESIQRGFLTMERIQTKRSDDAQWTPVASRGQKQRPQGSNTNYRVGSPNSQRHSPGSKLSDINTDAANIAAAALRRRKYIQSTIENSEGKLTIEWFYNLGIDGGTNLTNAITTIKGSNIMNIRQKNHNIPEGTFIIISKCENVQGIPADQINGRKEITIVDENNYKISVTDCATGTSIKGEGGVIMIQQDPYSFGEDNRITAISYFIKYIPKFPQYINILNEAIDRKLWPTHVKKSLAKGFIPLHEVNWLAVPCDHEILKQLYAICYRAGCDPYGLNKYNEDSFLNLSNYSNSKYMQTQKAPAITLSEYEFRLMQLCSFPPETVEKITRSVFNKIGSIKDRIMWVERLQFVIAINYRVVIDTLANILITRKTTNSCNQYDESIKDYVSLILRSFSGSDDGYSKTPFINVSIMRFFGFKHATKTPILIPGANELLVLLFNSLVKFGFSKSDKKTFNLECLGVTIGAIANEGAVVDQYYRFILDCLNEEAKKDQFAEVSQETRMKMAIRALIHGKKLNEQVKAAFKSAQPGSGFIAHTIQELIGEKTTLKMSSSTVPNKPAAVVIDDLDFFSGLNLKRFDEIVEHSCVDIEKILTRYPQQRKQIIQRVLICILGQITPDTINQMKKLVEALVLMKIGFNELVANEKIIENDILPDLIVDVPCAKQTWNYLKAFLQTNGLRERSELRV